MWTYGIQLRGTSSNSNLEILKKMQNKVLSTPLNAPEYVANSVMLKDLKIFSIKEEIIHSSVSYIFVSRISMHRSVLAKRLLKNTDKVRRLKRFKP